MKKGSLIYFLPIFEVIYCSSRGFVGNWKSEVFRPAVFFLFFFFFFFGGGGEGRGGGYYKKSLKNMIKLRSLILNDKIILELYDQKIPQTQLPSLHVHQLHTY